MSNAMITTDAAQIMEAVITKGDLAKLTPEERTRYYATVCQSVGLNALTKPFEYITLNGKLTLYARKDATDQLRSLRGVSVVIASRERLDDVYLVTARATTADGRTDESIGAVSIAKLAGDALANALMKAETKAKRRVTLSICGLGMLDESELETIPGAAPVAVPAPVARPAAVKQIAPESGSVMTPQQFKARWENGGGITYDDIADCAIAWGLTDSPRTKDLNRVRDMVLKAAGIKEANESLNVNGEFIGPDDPITPELLSQVVDIVTEMSATYDSYKILAWLERICDGPLDGIAREDIEAVFTNQNAIAAIERYSRGKKEAR